jgi:hypothetical protein
MSDYPPDDTQYEEHTLTAVTPAPGGGWSITADGLSFFCPATSPIEPRAGMSARYYGKGFGYVVRGLFIDGHRVFYRTDAEQRDHELAELEVSEQAQRDEFERNRATLDERFDALPAVFRERINKFRATNPEFRWRFEGYELFCCEEAIKLIDALKTAPAVREFQTLDHERQRKLVPAIGDGHSGNTFGVAVSLAHEYLVRPDRVVLMHGALTPLVGCEAYGCPHPWPPAR